MIKSRHKDSLWGYLMISPLVIGLSIFYFIPFFGVIRNSFYQIGAFNQSNWVGLENYQRMMTDEVVWSSLRNTFLYVLIIVPAVLFFTILIATLLNQDIKGKSIFRTIYFIPTVTMSAAVAMIWRWIYNGDYGILNYILVKFNMEPVLWLSNSATVIPAISVVSVWMSIGLNVIIILAGMQGISRSFYEAAQIDGASGIQQFFKITIPLLTPTIFFVLITTLIATFQTFDVIYMMISSTSLVLEDAQSIVMYFYRNAFPFSKKGYASAIAMLLFLIIMFITLIQLKLQEKWVNYD